MRSLEVAILREPAGPRVMRGTGGLRKIRFGGHQTGAGKSGGVRVCYAYFSNYGLVYLCAVFPKHEKANLTPAERNAYKKVIEDFERYLRQWYQKGWTP